MSAWWQLRGFAGWCVLLGLLWWLLTDGAGLGFALLLVPACALAGCLLAPATRWRLRPVALTHFAVFFLWQSLRAGLDVALRILHPRLRVAPGLCEIELRLPAGQPRRLLAQTLSLLPGTLSVRLDGPELLLHVLDQEQDVVVEVRRAERYVAAVYGVVLEGAS